MSETKEPYFELCLSFEQEQDKIKGLVETFEGVGNPGEIRETIFCLKELSACSKNSITTGIIYQCSEKMNKGLIHPNMKEEIGNGISRELFPLLFENLDNKKEKLKPQEVAQLLLSIYDTKHKGLEENVAILLKQYTNDNFKKVLVQFLKPTI